MSTYGPFHRLGSPGGPGCRVAVLPVQGRTPGGALTEGSLLDGGEAASELELLRTVAAGLGVHWGHDSLGWWAAVPQVPVSGFTSRGEGQQGQDLRYALFREDDNGARFLIGYFDSEEKAEQRAAELAHGGHKQHYFIEPVTPE
ncbi:MAG: hypothetical protein JWM59_4988 [Verrucomicrobiales bacterium]|nr:hypothetical protein [Verrucomicrobiales bacterium]